MQGVTANCGNGTIGFTTVAEMLAQFNEPDAPDVMVINCQEVHFAEQMLEFQTACNRNRRDLVCLPSALMQTYTDIRQAEVRRGKTGITSFVIYNKNVCTVALRGTPIEAKQANKGGLISDFIVTTKTAPESPFDLRAISGHLDSFDDNKRMKNWRILHEKNAIEAKDWETLAAKVPHIQVAGYDANTRNLWNAGKAAINMWKEKILNYRIAPLVYAVLGKLTSADNTYHTSKPDYISKRENGRRKDYVRAGALDFVAKLNATQPHEVTAPGTGYALYKDFGEESTTPRDHNVIVSKPTEINLKISDFERVKNYQVAMLTAAAPRLAQEIQSLNETADNKQKLLAIQNEYLAPNGKLIARINAEKPGVNMEPWFANARLNKELSEDIQLVAAKTNVVKSAYGDTSEFGYYERAYNAFIEALHGANVKEIQRAHDKLLVATGMLQSPKVSKDAQKIAAVKALEKTLDSIMDKQLNKLLTSDFKALLHSKKLSETVQSVADKAKLIKAAYSAKSEFFGYYEVAYNAFMEALQVNNVKEIQRAHAKLLVATGMLQSSKVSKDEKKIAAVRAFENTVDTEVSKLLTNDFKNRLSRESDESTPGPSPSTH